MKDKILPHPESRSALDEYGVLVHHLPVGGSGHNYIAYEFRCENFSNDYVYEVSASLYIPSAFTGESIGLSFYGYHTQSSIQVDMDKRNVWQDIMVSAEIPQNHHDIVPALTINSSTPQSEPIYTKNWNIRKNRKRRSFKVITCATLAESGNDAVVVGEVPDVSVPVVPIKYGQTIIPDFPVVEHPPGGWEAYTMVFKNQRVYEIQNAVIHGEEGIVTVGDYVLEESYLLASLEKINFRWDGDGFVSFEVSSPTTTINRGSYHFSGFPGNRNYAHWMVDILPSINKYATSSKSALLLPELYFGWQSATLDMVDSDQVRVFLKNGQAVQCKKLIINYMRLADSGHWPHPERVEVANLMKEKVHPDPSARRRIYISRIDSNARKLVNEDEVIAVAREFGFEILTLTGMPVADQIRAFAEAEIVLGSHGAGLSNIIFCRANAIFCEMLVDGYVQWSMRRLASVLPLRYGCAIGREIGLQANQHDKQWQIDINDIRKMLQAALADVH